MIKKLMPSSTLLDNIRSYNTRGKAQLRGDGCKRRVLLYLMSKDQWREG